MENKEEKNAESLDITNAKAQKSRVASIKLAIKQLQPEVDLAELQVRYHVAHQQLQMIEDEFKKANNATPSPEQSPQDNVEMKVVK